MEEKPINTDVRVCYNRSVKIIIDGKIFFLQLKYFRTSHPEMLTEKEIESVTTVFRSFESGLRGATINPSVGFNLKIKCL